jgi:hypothetical protein
MTSAPADPTPNEPQTDAPPVKLTPEQLDIVMSLGKRAVNGYLDFPKAWEVIGELITAAENAGWDRGQRGLFTGSTDRIPEGFISIGVYGVYLNNSGKLVVLGEPTQNDDEEKGHNCDAMGCGSFDHAIINVDIPWWQVDAIIINDTDDVLQSPGAKGTK